MRSRPEDAVLDTERFIPPGQVLEFITQTGPRTTDPILKRKIRRQARNHVSRSKGVVGKAASLLQVQLVVPEAFGTSASSEGSTPELSFSMEKGSANELVSEVEVEYQYSNHSLDLPIQIETGLGTVRSAGDLNIDETKKTYCQYPMSEYCLETQVFKELETTSLTRVLGTWDSSPILPYQPSITPRFQDQTEALYFYAFRKETSVELSGVFKSSFWDTLLLQESHNEPFVRHALIAIAALNKSIKASQLTNIHPDASTVFKSEREYAFKYYGKALTGMQRIPQRENAHLRQLVIAMLLVFVFETIQQQPDIAFSHALIGDRLLCHFVKTTPHSIPHKEGISSPATQIVESELLMTYCRFDTQMMTFRDVRSPSLHTEAKTFCQSTVDDMPEAFLNLREATLYWEVVMRRSGHFILSTSAINDSLSLARRFSTSCLGKTLELNAQTSMYGSPNIVPDSIFLDSIRHLFDIEKWRLAVTPLFKRLQREPTDIQTRTAIMFLRLYSITLRIVVQGTTFTDECQYDRFLLDFSEIVFLARKISNNLLEITNRQPAYHFHLSIVPPLFTLLLRCRDGDLRREAIRILKTVRYDGPWDRYVIAAVGEWIMETEEAESEDGRIPRTTRLTLSRLSISVESGCAAVQCVRRSEAVLQNGESELEWVETIVRPVT